MFKSTGIKIIGLVLVALVVLSGGIYATTALLPGGASAHMAPSQPAPTQAARLPPPSLLLRVAASAPALPA